MRSHPRSLCLLFALAAVSLFRTFAQSAPSIPTSEVEAPVDAWMAQLTTEEKVDLIAAGSSCGTQAVPRLGIPAVSMTDGPVGTRNASPSIAYAGGIGLAASWDPAMAMQVGQQLARDATIRIDQPITLTLEE